jgi:hypothetical protein
MNNGFAGGKGFKADGEKAYYLFAEPELNERREVCVWNNRAG